MAGGCATQASPTSSSSAIPAPRRWNARSRWRANTTSANGAPERYRIITFEGAFHGRTLATLAAGGQKKYLEGFGPVGRGLRPGAVRRSRSGQGARSARETARDPRSSRSWARAACAWSSRRSCGRLRELCDQHGLLLIFDEVQTGMGRTGELFAYQRAGVEPGHHGARQGARRRLSGRARAWRRAEAAKGMTAGTHGSTFGGNPLAMSVADAVLDVMLEPGFLDRVRRTALLLQAAARGDQGSLSVGHRRGARRRPAGRPARRACRPANWSTRCAPKR